MRFSTSERQLVLLCVAVLFGSFVSAQGKVVTLSYLFTATAV